MPEKTVPDNGKASGKKGGKGPDAPAPAPGPEAARLLPYALPAAALSAVFAVLGSNPVNLSGRQGVEACGSTFDLEWDSTTVWVRWHPNTAAVSAIAQQGNMASQALGLLRGPSAEELVEVATAGDDPNARRLVAEAQKMEADAALNRALLEKRLSDLAETAGQLDVEMREMRIDRAVFNADSKFYIVPCGPASPGGQA
jgi:hypothetical protein